MEIKKKGLKKEIFYYSNCKNYKCTNYTKNFSINLKIGNNFIYTNNEIRLPNNYSFSNLKKKIYRYHIK